MTWKKILKEKGYATEERTGTTDDYSTMARKIGNDLGYGDSTDMWLDTDNFNIDVEIKNIGTDMWRGGKEPKYHKDFKGSKERYRATESFGIHLIPKGKILLVDDSIGEVHTFSANDVIIEKIDADVSNNTSSAIFQINVVYYIEDYHDGKLIIYPMLM
tara:strand:- start:1144 stop:1620 length:477 start_codon:yes stop_codon:yes gene_type:complete